MKFVIYNVENCRTRENRVGKRSIRFNSVTGNMYLSTKLAKEMNITMNDRLEFGCDENNPKEWFLHKTTDKRGFPLQFNRGGTRLRNKYICKTILDIAKVKESATFLVSKDPVKTELGPFYRIILSCPILPKTKPKLKADNLCGLSDGRKPSGRIAGQPIPFIVRLLLFYLQAVSLLYAGFPNPVNQWKVCAVTSRQGKVREAVQNRRQPGSCRSMPELRPVETTRYSTARPVFMPLVSDFPPLFRIFPL